MDQAPKSIDRRRTDHNNNSPKDTCTCSNISIMQLFHEMKQEFPKVPDHIVQQHVTENCHNRRACIDAIAIATTTSTPTTMYPSKSIHSNQQTPRSPVNGLKWANNQKMKEISEMFENSSSDASTSSEKVKRPTTLKLRRAPDPPSSTVSSTASTPNSTTNLSKFSSTSSSTSSLVASTTSVSSISSSNQQSNFSKLQTMNQQFHHNVTLDSTASKFNDSLNVQLNVTVSPITSSAPPIPPRPLAKPGRHVSQLSVQPEPAFTRMLEQKTSPGGTSTCSGTTGQRSYTSVNFTLRQPTSILPEIQTPIDIQAGPSSLTYSSSSFDAKQGFQSHLKITVAGNGESCIQAVRTKQPAINSLPEVSQIDTTISVGGKEMRSCGEPIRIISNPNNLPMLPIDRMTEDELRQLIQKQMKQKELLECELFKEREKLDMVRFDIITLTSPILTRDEMHQLCDEISRLRSACERLADEIDVVAAPLRSPVTPTRQSRPPPPIPAALRCLSLHQSPYHTRLSPQEALSRLQPPSYNEVMRESRLPITNSLPNLVDDVNEGAWACSLCTFLNYPLLNTCEQCEMPRVQGIRITSSSYRPLQQNNQLQGTASVATNHDNVVQATAL